VGIFSAILDKIRHHAAASAPQQSAPQSAPQSSAQQTQYQPSSTQQQGAPQQASIQNVDVDKVLRDLAAQKGGGGNYRESIVDLLKLLDLDSSLDARKQLATELGVNAGAPGSAEQNIALHKAVMRKIAENGGKVPDSMKH
jgi:Domain of unknown function (DUF3597)